MVRALELAYSVMTTTRCSSLQLQTLACSTCLSAE